MLKKLNFFFFLLLFVCSFSFGQNTYEITVDWGGEKTVDINGSSFSYPSINNQDYAGRRLTFAWYQSLKDNQIADLEVLEFQTAPLTSADEFYLSNEKIDVLATLDVDLKVSKRGRKRWIGLSLFPYVKEEGVVKKVTSVTIEKKNVRQENYFVQKDFVANSVLKSGSGEWYKISVSKDGIYKIDYSFLEECGFNVSNLNPNWINIFGNGDGRLPELNSEPRTDDLAKNSIEVFDGNDGSFDQGDYLIFYGWGPHRWRQTGSRFDNDRNPYSDESFYFININSNDSPKRVENLPLEDGAVTHSLDQYDYRTVKEDDLYSLVGGGQRWYGDLFDTQLSKTYGFTIPNLVTADTILFHVAIASNSSSTVGTKQKFTLGTTNVGEWTLPSSSAGNYGRSVRSFTGLSSSASVSLRVDITRNSPSTLTYLDRILINARAGLSLVGNELSFRDLASVGGGNVAEFTVSQLNSNSFVWDVTNRHAPRKVSNPIIGSQLVFKAHTDSLREFVASSGTGFNIPSKVGRVEYQNLHGLANADYLIVTPSVFMGQAERLANLHRSTGMTVHVVTQGQVFNEFSSGMKDPVAIRSFAKMFYDRAAGNPSLEPKYLLLFGDGTYDPKDRVENNNNYIITYQALNSENHIEALVSDDFFGLLDDNESFTQTNMMDIGVGRLLISDNTIAKQQVDKIEHYMKNGSEIFSSSNNSTCISEENNKTFGDWRNLYVQIADDEENGYFINNDVEVQYDSTELYYPEMNCRKIYLDAYDQISSAGGQRYPDVNAAINESVENGAILINYVGHGGEVGVAEERVITVPQIQGWENVNSLPLIVSATCEFTKYDDPDRVSAGEWASLNPTGGGIALMTTTRSVYFSVNTSTGRSFFSNVFKRDANNLPRPFGTIIMDTKNGASGSNNKRSFTLIGDPALRIALPTYRIKVDSINGVPMALFTDTIKALSKVTVVGHVEDRNGAQLTGFNGLISPTIFDKASQYVTLGNDASSPQIPFELMDKRLFKGVATVSNGMYEYSFVVPKDIQYAYGNGKISSYAASENLDAAGEEQNLIIGGIDPNGVLDNVDPELELFMNDDDFVNGGITNENPMLLAKLFDENGINAVGNGVGHDLIGILDGNTGSPIILNNYYTANVDTYKSGEIRYAFTGLSIGKHTLTVKIWDVSNNSTEKTIEFEVRQNEDIELAHVLNYPNPFTTRTEFFFEHNQVCSQLEAQIQIMTISGKVVRTINQTVQTEGFRSHGIAWDGRDEFGDKLARGVYVYYMRVKDELGKVAVKTEKLVIL